MKVKTEEYVRLTEEVCWKLDVIQSSIIEDKTKKELIEGGVDLMFTNALKNLYEEGEIKLEGLRTGLEHVPEYLGQDLRMHLEAATK